MSAAFQLVVSRLGTRVTSSFLAVHDLVIKLMEVIMSVADYSAFDVCFRCF